jgi:hypothetical protein
MFDYCRGNHNIKAIAIERERVLRHNEFETSIATQFGRHAPKSLARSVHSNKPTKAQRSEGEQLGTLTATDFQDRSAP